MENIVKTIDLAIEYLPVKTKVYRISRDAALLLKDVYKRQQLSFQAGVDSKITQM